MTRLKSILIILLPVLLLIISLISSIIAFNYSKLTDETYIYIENESIVPAYTGEYFAIIGNLTDDAYKIKVETNPIENNTSASYNIEILDEADNTLEKYLLIISDNAMNHVSESVTVQVEEGILFELEEYIIKLDLNKDTTYILELQEIENNTEKDEIDLAFFHLNNEYYDRQDLFEGISFTTFIFALLSGLTILAIIFTKKE